MNRKQIIAALRARGITFDGQSSTPVLNLLLRTSWLTVRNSDDPGYEAGDDYDAEMCIMGTIGTSFYDNEGYSARQFHDELAPLKGKRVLLNIHSPGGNLWDADSMAAEMDAHGNVDTKILGVAASAADRLFQSGKKRIMPRASHRMGHFTSAGIYMEGNAEELEAQKAEIDKLCSRLKKHDDTLVKMYAARSGQTEDEVREDMRNEEFMDGDESLAKGYCDELSDDEPMEENSIPENFKGFPTAILNHFSAAKAAGKPQPTTQGTIVNKKQKIALLNSWGVSLPTGQTEETVTDTWLDAAIEKGKPVKAALSRESSVTLLNSWGVTTPANSTDDDLLLLVAKGKPTAAPANNNPIINLDDHPTVKAMKKQMEDARKEILRNRITAIAGEDRIPVNQIEDWVTDAFAATDTVDGNPVVNRLAQLPPRPPGIEALTVELGKEDLTIGKLDKVVNDLMKPATHMVNNRMGTPPDEIRKAISGASRKIAALVNSMKKIDYKSDPKGVLVGPLRDAWDARAAGIQNANTMSAALLRQVILSELMRAFRREFAHLDKFAHNHKDVALQGTDKVEVPYYPLDTVASTEFVQANGYVIAPNATTSNKEIIVGGKGDNVAHAGYGRKYKGLQFSAYEIARQPWLNIAQLIVMAAEQLAIDVRGDIIGANVSQANFGNAIWTGAAGAFNKLAFTNYLLNAAIKAFWPLNMRHAILIPDLYTNLIGDPGLQRVNEAGTDETLRRGIVSSLLSFASVDYDALLPLANYIRGGDGAVTAGPDLNSAGFIAYPSAILIATAPVMPGPATMRLLASYEQVTDEQTGLTFSYQYFGNILGSNDNELIECSYGSGLGELAALKRLTTAGV